MSITGRQIAAARTLLGLAQSDLAKRSDISVATLKRMEASPAEALGLANNVKSVRLALEAAGALFIPANGEDVGVRLRRDRKGEQKDDGA